MHECNLGTLLLQNSQQMGTISQAPDFIGLQERWFLVSARMSDTTKKKILDLLYRALKPLSHLLIEAGIGHREFAEVAKRAYVDVASKHYGIRGRDTNISRVAVMTGLTRKEVKRIRDEAVRFEASPSVKDLPAGRVLQFWHSDSEFSTADGKPLPLNFSDAPPSFFSLVRKYAGDIPAGALRTELKRAGAITVEEDGTLTAERREFRIIDADQQFAWSLGRGIFGTIYNAAHNFFERKKTGSKRLTLWPSRIVEAISVDASNLEEVREIVAREATEFCEKLDDAIAPYSDQGDAKDVTTVRISLVYFQDP